MRPRPLAALALLLTACLPSPRIHPRAAEEVRRGYQHLDAGDVERAEVAFHHALELAPDLAEAWNGAGVAAERRGHLAAARERFARAVASRPDFAEGHVNLGVVALAQGEAREAERRFRAALDIDPDLAVARLDLARALLHRGRAEPEDRPALWAAARTAYLHLLETAPHHPEAWHDLAFLSFEEGRFDRAEREFGRAAALEPGSAPAHHGLCISLVRLGRCQEGATACRRCLELLPGSAVCRQSLAGAEGCAMP